MPRTSFEYILEPFLLAKKTPPSLIKMGTKKLQKWFPSAKISYEEKKPSGPYRVWVTIVWTVEYKNKDLRAFNSTIEKEVISKMTSTELLSQHTPRFQLNQTFEMRNPDTAMKTPFLSYSDLPFHNRTWAIPKNWNDWITWVELAYKVEALETKIRQMKETKIRQMNSETIGEKIVVLLEADDSSTLQQTLELLEVVEDELSKAELTAIVNAIGKKMQVLGGLL